MKRRIIIVLITTTMVMAVWFFFQARHGGLELGATAKGLSEYSDPAKVIKVAPGREFVIALESNPTTGYSWHLAGALDKKMLKVVEIRHNAKKTKLIGSGGKDLWTLRGLQTGDTQLAFEYARSWEKDVPPVKRSVFTVRIHS